MIELSRSIKCRLLLELDVNSFGVFYRYNGVLIQGVEKELTNGEEYVLIVTSVNAKYLRLDIFNNMTKKTFDDYLITRLYNFSLN